MGANAIGILGGGFTLAEREATTMTHSGMRRMAAAAAAVLLLTAAAGLTGAKPKKTPASSEPGASERFLLRLRAVKPRVPPRTPQPPAAPL